MILGNKFVWWTGVVEDREDPEKLGRCRVRIFGYHTEDTSLLPTSDLPWAIPIQSTTSAATSGVGHTPVGIVPGTWVVGWFLDGEEAQRPLMIGTIAGKPDPSVSAIAKQTQDTKLAGVVKAPNGSYLVNQNNQYVLTKDQTLDLKNRLGPLKPSDIDTMLSVISSAISGGSYTKESSDGNLGKYQFSINTLVDLGYVKRCPEDIVTSAWTNDITNWTGKDAITSKAKFLENTNIQETAALTLTENNYKSLLAMGKITELDDPKNIASLLGTALVMGTNNADKLSKKDNDGKLAKDYFVAVNSALGGNNENFNYSLDDAGNYLSSTLNTNTSGGALNNSELKLQSGFKDPNKQYPKAEYTGLSDINKLAVGDTSHKIFKVKKNKKIDNIPLASSKQTWNEPTPAYGAGYPYNQVIETEAGHVIELDNTPGAERIQVFHKSGSYIEIDVNGSMVRKTVGENYEINDRNNFVYVKGAHSLTVEGQTNILVKSDAKIQVDGDLSVTSHGSTMVQTARTASIIAEDLVVTAAKSITLTSEGSVNIQGKNINLYAKDGSITEVATKDISLETGRASTLSLNGGLATLIEGAVVKTKMGANDVVPINRPVLDRPVIKSPNKIGIPVLPREVISKANYYFDAGETGADSYINTLQTQGIINPNIVSKIDNAGASLVRYSKVTEVDDAEIRSFNYFPRSFILSNKENRIFSLGDLLQDGGLVAQRELTEQQIVYNLKQLTINCLDPIKAKYPDMKINSGFRPISATVTGSNPEKSDHGLGAAADIKFTNTKFADYKNIAEWIVQNVPHKQVILEYYFESGSNKLVSSWIHIALLVSNNTVVSSAAPVQTFANHRSVSRTLVNLA